MSEENKKLNNKTDNKDSTPFSSKTRKPFTKRRQFGERPKEEFEQRILDIARVTRVMKGGKRMSFRACVAIGDKKGRVSVALGKGADVSLAVNKAVNKAKKNIVEVPVIKGTIPHEISYKFGSAQILLKPAPQGRGVIAGGVVRVILNLAGVKNVTSKILGSNNKVNNSKATILALKSLRHPGFSDYDNKNNKDNLNKKNIKLEKVAKKTDQKENRPNEKKVQLDEKK